VENTVVFLKTFPEESPWTYLNRGASWTKSTAVTSPHFAGAQNTALQMKSSDAVLHTVHMDGVATYNLPFPFTNQVVSRSMPSADWSTSSATAGMYG